MHHSAMRDGGGYGVCTKHGIVYQSLDPSAIHSAMLRWRLGTTMLWCVHQNQVHHVEFLSIAMWYGGIYGVCTKHGIVYPTPIRGHVPAASPAAITKCSFRRKLSKYFETKNPTSLKTAVNVPAASPSITKRGFRQELSKWFEIKDTPSS